MKPVILPATMAALYKVSEYVLTAAATAKLNKKATYCLRLAVDETATNIVSYGYALEEQGRLYLSSRCDEQQLAIILEDTAAPYNPLAALAAAERSLQLPFEQRPIGGLGVYIAWQSADEFHYELVGDRNRNTFVMYRDPTSE
ncbi:MAG: ATP-binding protein [Spirulinaceae cyanobacterium SM2_1_0]|nr:ATP-binding protein [Spirulinaceae cyanobacterium SM2_1_0]